MFAETHLVCAKYILRHMLVVRFIPMVVSESNKVIYSLNAEHSKRLRECRGQHAFTLLYHGYLERERCPTTMSSKQIPFSQTVLFLQPPKRRQYIVDMVRVLGVPGRIVWRARVSWMVRVGRETVVDRGEAGNLGAPGIFE